MGKKKVHYGSDGSGWTDAFDAWAQCHDVYERNDSKLTLNWEFVTCLLCLKSRPKPKGRK